MNWSLLGCYTGFRKREWCEDSPRFYNRITNPLWGDRPDLVALIAEEFVLKDAQGIQVAVTPSTSPSNIQHAEMQIHYQKNQDNYQVFVYSMAQSSPDTCPVCTILCILQ